MNNDYYFQGPGYISAWPQSNWGMQPRTNKILVTSLDEAIAKSNERNSELVYFDQSKPLIYIVKVDMTGVKSWAQLEYSTGAQDTNSPATKSDIAALTGKIEALVAKLEPETPKRKKKEVEVVNDESDG